MEPARSWPARRIYYLHTPLVGALDRWGAQLDKAKSLGFDTVLVSPLMQPGEDGDVFLTFDPGCAHPALGGGAVETIIATIRDLAEARGLQLWMDLALHRFSTGHPLVQAYPEAFNVRGSSSGEAPADPRRAAPIKGEALSRLDDPTSAERIAHHAEESIARWAKAGLQGLRVLQPHAGPPAFWRRVIEGARAEAPGLAFIAETQAAPREAILALAGCGLDALTSSLPWWDGRERWFVEEYEALRTVAPLIAEVEVPFGPRLSRRIPQGLDASTAYAQRLALAAATGAGLLLPMGFEALIAEPLDPRSGGPSGEEIGAPELTAAIRAATALSSELSRFDGELRILTGEGSPVTALLRADMPDVRRAGAALLVLINPDPLAAADCHVGSWLAGAGAAFEPFSRVDGGGEPFTALAPGEVRLALARRGGAIVKPIPPGSAAAEGAATAARLVIEAITPRVEGGPYPVRRIVGERVVVEADIFADGHEPLSAELRWRARDEEDWSSVRMEPTGNDRWRASFPLLRLGRHEFVVQAWLDVYAGFRRDYAKKRNAGVDQPVDVQEGGVLVAEAAQRSSGALKGDLVAAETRLKEAPEAERRDLLLGDPLAELMRRADNRPFRHGSMPQIVDAERLQARFASWYELFPRSQTDDAARHGTFDDVIARLPALRAMGFDVLYFPPIHPIGAKNRKGRNNSLTPTADDPGSPYAIGSDDGGHDAIHPQLGTLEDFRRLIAASTEHGLEVALDFAVQCSPDHPWLRQHPGWFDWRPNSSIKYAENPPKKSEDIVNVDFYKPDAVPDLWLALRDIVLFWTREGVRLFRVDNPHTKPLPFWEWMIREVHAAYPDVVFLAEAFTRPKVMYRLSKIGFSQSYTYFTWRNTKAEFIDYLTELTQTAPKEFFRPHFFVNTPDINPHFLQTSGRGGFLIRAALAATLSGLWGVYSGFELLDAEPMPGKEEYLDSEKYEIKPRDWSAPGNIIAEITRLNRIRRGRPALQTHLGVSFLPGWNDNVLVFLKATERLDDVIVTAISLDPHAAQETSFELPLWDWGLSDDASVDAEDLLWEQRFTWTGKLQSVRLDPDHPYAIWSLRLPARVVS